MFRGETLRQIGQQAFSEAIEIGIGNTIAALYAANVKDKDILRVVNEYWGISTRDIEDRIVGEKKNATVRSLRQYLKLQGYSQANINSFMLEHNVVTKISHDEELWKLKDNPEIIFDAVQ